MEYYAGKYDIAVIGAGHAGCEAALAAARMGYKTLIFSKSLSGDPLIPWNSRNIHLTEQIAKQRKYSQNPSPVQG